MAHTLNQALVTPDQALVTPELEVADQVQARQQLGSGVLDICNISCAACPSRWESPAGRQLVCEPGSWQPVEGRTLGGYYTDGSCHFSSAT